MTSPLNGKEWSKDGWGTHMKGQNSGHEVAVHPYELRERHLDHRLGATLEHARDFGLKDLIVPRLLHLVGGSAKCQIKVTNTPAIPRVAQVAVPKRVHLLTPRVPELPCELYQFALHLISMGQMDALEHKYGLLKMLPLLGAIVMSLPDLPNNVGPALAKLCVRPHSLIGLPKRRRVVRHRSPRVKLLVIIFQGNCIGSIH